jgi:arylsulfatase A-like enzyme
MKTVLRVLLLILFLVILTISIIPTPLPNNPDMHLESKKSYHCPNCNVLLISIDTLRADHVGAYGYEHNTTPFIDSVADKGILFKYAFTSSPVTLPSHATMLTGLYLFQHGALDNGRFFLSKEAVTLPEILKRDNFKTSAFVSTFVLDDRFGLDQGFDIYNDDLTHPKNRAWREKWFNHSEIEYYERKADNVTQAVLDWLDKNGQNRFFTFLHYFDPHESYNPPKEYKNLFDSVKPNYDGEIRFTDDQIKRVFEKLEELDISDRTFVIIVADHGQGLGDHGERLHGGK